MPFRGIGRSMGRGMVRGVGLGVGLQVGRNLVGGGRRNQQQVVTEILVRCPSCNQTNPEHQKFCGSCGADTQNNKR